MNKDLTAIINPDGALQFGDLGQCIRENWIPLLVYHKNDKIYVPCFEEMSIARRFCNRNFPKKWLKGSIELSIYEIDFIKENDWEIVVLDFPKLLNYKIDHKIINFKNTPDFKVR